MSNIIKVLFKGGKEPKEFFFGSLTAIYDRFTPRLIGCRLYRLWGAVRVGHPYETPTCIISKHILWRKPQKKDLKKNKL